MSLPVNSLYSLTWGDYGTSLVSAVQLLRCHGDLVDVTLAAEGRSFEAHKIVLCAASPYLLNLLKNTTCKHPIVMLAGVSASDLEALLEFVYRGEVSVDHSQLPSLLQAAQCLNIQGLAPQTVTHKDDTAYTSIQIHPGLVHQDVKTHILEVGGNMGEELIMQQPQQVQTHHQIVEEILPEQMSDEVTKEVINQFLPQRKRKPRVPKTPGKQNPAKVIKLEPQASGSETITEITTIAEQSADDLNIERQEQVSEMIESIGEEQTEQVDQQSSTEVKVKGDPKTPKDKSNKPKSKSQSEQPATCPICSATIRQSRNLRRHLELRHFKKRTPKKIKKDMANAEQLGNTSSEMLTDNGNQTITVTMEPGSDQQTITVNGQQTGQQHVLTTNSDGSLSISGLPGHIIGSLGNATIIRTEDGQQIESGQLITTHEPSLRTSTGEVYRVGTTVYHIEERRDQTRLN